MLAQAYRAQAPRPAGSGPVGSGKSGRLERDFTIVQALGAGEFSQVWKVKEKSTGLLFAVKAGKPYTGYKNRSVLFLL